MWRLDLRSRGGDEELNDGAIAGPRHVFAAFGEIRVPLCPVPVLVQRHLQSSGAVVSAERGKAGARTPAGVVSMWAISPCTVMIACRRIGGMEAVAQTYGCYRLLRNSHLWEE